MILGNKIAVKFQGVDCNKKYASTVKILTMQFLLKGKNAFSDALKIMNFVDCEKALAAILLFITAFFEILWLFLDRKIPISDAGDHYRIASLIYMNFAGGFHKGVWFFFHTGGKPVLFSIFAAPYVAFFNQNDFLAAKFFIATTVVLMLIAYVWLFLFKINLIKSALISCIISTFPFLFALNVQFMPEVLWQIWFVFFLGCIARVDGFRVRKYSVLGGLFLALTVLARPIESAILLLCPIAIYFLWFVGKKLSTRLAIFSGGLYFMVSFLGCCAVSWYAWGWLSGVFVLAATTCGFYWVVKLSPENGDECKRVSFNMFLFVAEASVVINTWMIFYFDKIYRWGYENSFGMMAKITDQRNTTKSLINIFGDLLSSYGGVSSWTLLFLLLLLLIVTIRKKGVSRFALVSAVIAVSSLLPMLFGYSTTGTSDDRRILLGMILFYVGIFFNIDYLSKLKQGVLGKLFLAVLSVLYMCQVLGVVFSDVGEYSKKIFVNKILEDKLGIEYSYPNRVPAYDAQVIQSVIQYGVTNAKVAVYSLGLFSDRETFQTESLRYTTFHYDKTLQFSTLWGYSNYEPMKAVIDRLLKENFKYLLLDSLENPIGSKSERDQLVSHTFFVSDLLDAIKLKGVDKIPGLHYMARFKVYDRDVFLFRIYDVDAQNITASS